jgi:MarR family transcriptional regulator, organic hydroperoxide resistance regulator
MTENSDFPLDVSLTFLREIWALNHSLERASKRMEFLLGVTARQRIVIRILGKYPSITAGQLSTLLRIDPGTLSAAIARLEARGWVERGRDVKDQRRVTVMLTPKGKMLDVVSANTIENAINTTLSKTTDQERKCVSQFLARLIGALDEIGAGEMADI